MKKANQYLPEEKEIMEFFKTHLGSYNSIRIAELLIQGKVNHTTPHDAEWKHVRGIIFSLKSRGFAELQNEGAQVIEERFYSTPDRIEKYYNPSIDRNNANKISSKQKEITESIGGQITIAVSVSVILPLLGYIIYRFTGVNLSL